MNIVCSLQNNGSYECQTEDKALGKYTVLENQYTDVADISFDSSSCAKGCSWRAEFQLASGEIVPLRSYYTNTENIPKIVFDISQQMKAKESRITHIGEQVTPFWAISFASCMTGIFIFVAIIKLIVGFRKNTDKPHQPFVIDLRK
ncbi:MAG: hypothetical protein HYZ22_10580 [Chloroflexi bacterium]|nr:hypothetical protein [Chloroflexota bacterium]